MQMPNRHSGSYRYLGANGQESETEITGDNSHSSAEYWMYDNRLGRRWNLDPKPQVSISDYAAFGNNPLLFTDVYGDSIDISGLTWFAESEYGAAFQAFVNTKEGKDFLKDYAGAGQTLFGVTFEEDGMYHSQGINLIYDKWVTRHTDMETGDPYGPYFTPEGHVTNADNTGNSINGSYQGLNIYIYIGEGFGTESSVLNKVIGIAHESLIHASAFTDDFLKDCNQNYAEIAKDIKNRISIDEDNYHHEVENDEFKNQGWSNKSDLWPNKGFEAIKEAKKYLGVGKVSDAELKKTMTNYYGNKVIK
jgi:hypothetical protein